jgi:hypothetical protein
MTYNPSEAALKARLATEALERRLLAERERRVAARIATDSLRHEAEADVIAEAGRLLFSDDAE